jgi:hypothetical protein
MSATLYALVVLQGTTLTFSPGYTTAAECLQQYKGPYVSCFPYDPERTTWTAFFKTPGSGFGSIWNFPNESVCQSYVGALRPDVPAACRQLARPESCPVSCVAPVQPPAPTGSIPPKPPEVTPPPEPDPKPDPASLNPKPSDIQVGGKQYTKVAGLTWVERESTKPDSFADVSVGPNDLQSKDQPTPLPPKTARAEAPQRRERYAPQQYAQRSPEPFRALIGVVMLPFDFLSYPGRRDW